VNREPRVSARPTDPVPSRECARSRDVRTNTHQKQTRGERDPLLNGHAKRNGHTRRHPTAGCAGNNLLSIHSCARKSEGQRSNASSAHTNRHTGKEATQGTISGPLHRRGHQNERRHRCPLSDVRHRLLAGSSLRRDPVAHAHHTADAGASQINRSPNTNAAHHTHPPSLEGHWHPNTHCSTPSQAYMYVRTYACTQRTRDRERPRRTSPGTDADQLNR
jgi:hypothetical protein